MLGRIKKIIFSRYPNLYSKLLQRSRKHLTDNIIGTGVEIGPGNLPMLFTNKVRVKYIDVNTQEELAQFYPQYKFIPLDNFIIADADEMKNIKNNQFDFLIACHVLEHVKNPLKAFKRWYEIVKPNGYIIIVIPNRDECFDKGRPYTSISHFVKEFKLKNNSKDMKKNLIKHIYEHYLNRQFKTEKEMLSQINMEREIKIGSAHYHVWGPENSQKFFNTADKMGLHLNVEKFEHKMGELRFLIRKTGKR